MSTPVPGGGGDFAQMVRSLSREQNWSEDFQRYTDAQINAMQPFWDPNKQRFRSEHAPKDATGDWVYVEKPSESVRDPNSGTEWGPWGNQVGVNVTAAGGGGTAASGSPTSSVNPGFGFGDLINSMVWNRVRNYSAQGQAGGLATPTDITKPGSSRGLFDIGYGNKGALTSGGGMVWGQIDPSWAGLLGKRGGGGTPWAGTAPMQGKIATPIGGGPAGGPLGGRTPQAF